MKKMTLALVVFAISLIASNAPTYAKTHHSHHARAHHHATHSRVAYDDGHVLGGRPAGCPHAFCGCEASRYVFGRIVPDLNLAANWMHKFAHTSPAPGMAAVRQHHVMILMSHVEGNEWLVHDGNSGSHLTREHVRSIAGYVIVNPRSAHSTELMAHSHRRIAPQAASRQSDEWAFAH